MSESSTGESPETSDAAFEALFEQSRALVETGHLEEAREGLERALEAAREQGDDRRVDGMTCALAAIAIQLRCGDGELPRLREILLRNRDAGNCRLAAYNISIHYQFARNYKKSLFYARIACERARQLGRPDWIGFSCNQLGNALLGESFVDQACTEYEEALRLIPEAGAWRAIVLDNLGYCRVLQKRIAEAYPLLYGSLRMMRRFSAERYQVVPHLDLCFTHLETGRYGDARRHGAAALAIAERQDHVDALKNALYLLGETANLSGNPGEASAYFSRLQRDYFPDSPYLTGFLMAVDVRTMINLHA